MANPIDLYLGQLRVKLESRFDSESADELLSEIRSHLVDAAAELELDGVSAVEAERLSIARFGAPERAAFLLPLGKQFGTGDRYWGRGAFWASTLATLALTWYGLDPAARQWITPQEIPPILALVLCFYGYACWKAKSFSMIRQSSVVVALILLATGLFQSQVVEPAFKGEWGQAEAFRAPKLPNGFAGASSWLTTGIGDLGIHGNAWSDSNESPALLRRFEAGSVAAPDERIGRADGNPLYGMAPIGNDPWNLTRGGALPEVSQLLLSWLFFILIANASVCWVGSLEHEQKSGALLVQ